VSTIRTITLRTNPPLPCATRTPIEADPQRRCGRLDSVAHADQLADGTMQRYHERSLPDVAAFVRGNPRYNPWRGASEATPEEPEAQTGRGAGLMNSFRSKTPAFEEPERSA